MAEALSNVVKFWADSRARLGLQKKITLILSGLHIYTLLCQLRPKDIASYDFDVSGREALAEATSMAMSKTLVPASLVEVLDLGERGFDQETSAEWPAQALFIIDHTEASLESKVSAAEIVLLYGPGEERSDVLGRLGAVLSANQLGDADLPDRTKLAIGLVGALTGCYLRDEESGDLIEYLSKDDLSPAIHLLNRWRFRGKLWRKVISSDPDVERDSLLRYLHQAFPNANYAAVTPEHFKADKISGLERRIGRPVLLHLAAQNNRDDWIDYIRSLDLGSGQIPLLQLALEGRPGDVKDIISTVNESLAQTSQSRFLSNLIDREDGYASLFDLEHYGEIEWPDTFFEAAIDALSQKGWIFKTSKVPQVKRQRILAGVWKKVVSGMVNLPTSLLQDHIGPYVQKRYNDGARKEFTERVLPALLSGESSTNLAWGVDFLFARHRLKSTIPEASDAQIQEAITRVYPNSQGEIKKQIERLASKKWFSLPSRLSGIDE